MTMCGPTLRKVRRRAAGALVLALALAAAGAACATVRLFSYDPADLETRQAAGNLTFEFEKRVLFTRILKIHSTEGQATADLKSEDESVLGRGGLSRLIGDQGRERDLYEVEPGQEGADLIHAFCPGSTRAWLAFSRMAEGRDLHVRVVGDAPGGGPVRLCHTFTFSYHGEWKVDSGQRPMPSQMLNPSFPYGS